MENNGPQNRRGPVRFLYSDHRNLRRKESLVRCATVTEHSVKPDFKEEHNTGIHWGNDVRVRVRVIHVCKCNFTAKMMFLGENQSCPTVEKRMQ